MEILNLKKNDVLDLTKKDPSLKRIVLAAGWDLAKKGLFSFAKDEYDLDLVAFMLGDNDKLIDDSGFIYFKNQRYKGVYLHNDNRTGAGHGDDEKISISLDDVPSNCTRVLFAITIYQAEKRKQSFSKVKNAYIRLLDADKGETEICRYNLTDDGGNATALTFAELERINGNWNFKAVGELSQNKLSELVNKYN